jgi:hypothetical protein
VTVREPRGTYREVTANRPDVIIKKKQERENMHTDRCGNTSRHKCHTKGSRKETKIHEFLYRDTTTVQHEMCDYTGGNWSHRNGSQRFKETFRSRTGKTFNGFAAEDSCTWNITH